MAMQNQDYIKQIVSVPSLHIRRCPLFYDKKESFFEKRGNLAKK